MTKRDRSGHFCLLASSSRVRRATTTLQSRVRRSMMSAASAYRLEACFVARSCALHACRTTPSVSGCCDFIAGRDDLRSVDVLTSGSEPLST